MCLARHYDCNKDDHSENETIAGSSQQRPGQQREESVTDPNPFLKHWTSLAVWYNRIVQYITLINRVTGHQPERGRN